MCSEYSVGVRVCCVDGSVVCCGELLWMDCACEWDLWSGVSFAGSCVDWVSCSEGCCVL